LKCTIISHTPRLKYLALSLSNIYNSRYISFGRSTCHQVSSHIGDMCLFLTNSW
jgi:hypothetical protein